MKTHLLTILAMLVLALWIWASFITDGLVAMVTTWIIMFIVVYIAIYSIIKEYR